MPTSFSFSRSDASVLKERGDMASLLAQLENLLRAMAANPYVGLAGTLVSVVSLVYALYVYRKTRHRPPKLPSSILTTNLVREREALFPALDIAFHGRSLTNITSSLVTISNSGQ